MVETIQYKYKNVRKSIATINPQIRKKFLQFLLKNNLYHKYVYNYVNDYRSDIIKDFGDYKHVDYTYWKKSDIIAMSFEWCNTEEGFSFWEKI